jgi:hypothetical protein
MVPHFTRLAINDTNLMGRTMVTRRMKPDKLAMNLPRGHTGG